MALAKKRSHNVNTNKVQGWNVREPVIIAEPNRQERINLDPDAFDRMIQQHGVKSCVFRTTYCPNVKSIDGGEHEIDCDMCNGSGFLDIYPIESFVFIHAQSMDKNHNVEGFVDGNTVMMTFPVGIEIQYFTLIELKDHTEIFFQRVARSHGELDRLKYKGVRVNVIIDKNNQQYFQDTDFTLTGNGDLMWKAGRGPMAEVIYSIHYEAKIQFRATKAVHVTRFEQARTEHGTIAQMKFPEQWLCTKEFMVRRHGINGEEMLPNAIPQYDEETPEE